MFGFRLLVGVLAKPPRAQLLEQFSLLMCLFVGFQDFLPLRNVLFSLLRKFLHKEVDCVFLRKGILEVDGRYAAAEIFITALLKPAKVVFGCANLVFEESNLGLHPLQRSEFALLKSLAIFKNRGKRKSKTHT